MDTVLSPVPTVVSNVTYNLPSAVRTFDPSVTDDELDKDQVKPFAIVTLMSIIYSSPRCNTKSVSVISIVGGTMVIDFVSVTDSPVALFI